jgi:hypothetical protein
MPKPPRTIRIAIQEPSSGWWQHVKRHARHKGMFVSYFVVKSIEHTLFYHSPELPSPIGKEYQNGEHQREDQTQDRSAPT